MEVGTVFHTHLQGSYHMLYVELCLSETPRDADVSVNIALNIQWTDEIFVV